MRKRAFWIVAVALSASCTEAGLREAQQTLGGEPHRIAGTGNLSEPRFAASGGSFLTVTDGGQPNLVFLVTAPTLQVEALSLRPPPPGAPGAPATIGEIARDPFSVPDDDSSGGSVTGSKEIAAFLSQASDLLAPGTSGFFYRDSTQAFLKDVASGENFLLSADPDGFPANHDVTSVSVSGNGRFVVFATAATNLLRPVNPSQAPNGASQVYVYDLYTGVLEMVSRLASGAPGAGDSTGPVISADGRFVAFRTLAADLVPNDTNATADIVLWDRSKRTMERISVDTAGGEQYLDAAEPAVSKDGLVVAFTAVDVNALGPRQVYVRDRGLNTTTIVSHAGAAGPGNGDSATPALSGDGRFVAFASAASNLDSSDSEGFTDVFVFDRMPALLARASIDVDGVGGGNGHSRAPSLSADGQFLAYVSEATNVAVDDPDRPNGDGNGLADLILVTQPFAP